MLSSTHAEQVIRDSAPGTPTEPPAELVQMSAVLVIDLVVCGLLIAGLSLVAQRFQPDLPLLTFFTGLVGGVLCFLWAVLGRRATCCRLGSMVTLVPMACVFVIQAVQSWAASMDDGSNGRKVALLMTVQVVFCVGMLANLAPERKGPRL
jgi:peptidoglycan/LPS O-acetylase OafA/YrhL